VSVSAVKQQRGRFWLALKAARAWRPADLPDLIGPEVREFADAVKEQGALVQRAARSR
jgi:hypothetical protein